MAKYLDSVGLNRLMEIIKAAFVTDVTYNSTSKKIQKSKAGSTSDVVTLATVATSGSYNDLSNKPTIPSGVSPYDSNPAMDGTASPGSSTLFSRGDHIHPTDTSRAANTDFTGSVGGAAGTHGLVPAPASGKLDSLMFSDGSWSDISSSVDTAASAVDIHLQHGPSNSLRKFVSVQLGSATIVSAGLMPAIDKAYLEQLKLVGPEANVQSDWNQTTTTADDYIKNKPGNASSSAAGLMSTAMYDKLDGIAAGAEVNVQSDWNQTTTTADDYIKNKPGDFVGVVGSTDVGVSGFVPAPENTAGHRGGQSFLNARGDWWYIANGSNISIAVDTTEKTLTITATNTKNTAGATDSSSKLFLIGATSQGANPQTYSQDTAYVGTNGHLYSNSKQVVNLSDTQALTNKTYNGYTLGAACAKAIGSVADGNTGLVTGDAVYDAIQSSIAGIVGNLVYKGAVSAASGMSNFKKGWSWIASAAFTIGSGSSAKSVEAGDMLIANADGASATTSNIDVIQTNIDTLTTGEVETLWANAVPTA